MPLTEFLRMSKRKVEATQLKPSTSNDPSCRGDTDCVELVWENGHITTQGQSSKARKVPSSSNFQALVPKAQDSKIGNGAKMSKMSTMDTVLADFPLSVPSSGMGLDQDVDMAPWLSYPVDDPLHNDYTSDFLRELSGVTINDPTMEKKSGFHYNGNSSAIDNMASLKYGSSSKASSSGEKRTEGGSSQVPQFSLPFHNNFSKSGNSDITGTHTSNSHHVTSRDPVVNQPSLYDFTSLRLQKMDAGQSSTITSGFTNFSYFSRPAAIARVNSLIVNESNRLEGDDNRCTLASSTSIVANSTVVNFSGICSQKEIVSRDQSLQAPGSGNLELLPAKPTEELGCSNQAVCREDVTMKNASQDQAHGTALTKAKMVCERNMEPALVTSSVCSGNSVERTSNEPSLDLKRKFREAVESDTPSDEAEEESVGGRKGVPPRNSLKRSRAAEVHNLSERRRRDRINEKMRALQELIPNCNKVDKASMLDEAIEYLKTLQLQVQMMSMGAGLYMQPMMVPPGMQPIHGAQMPHFSPMGVGMGMGMGFGMNMLNMNSSMKLMPFHGPQYPVTGNGPAFQVMAGSNLQPLGQQGQGIPMSMPQVPVPPMSRIPPLQTPMVANVSSVTGSMNSTLLASSSSSKDVTTQSVPVNSVNSQVTNEGTENPPPHNQAQPVNNSSVSAIAAYGTDTTPS